MDKVIQDMRPGITDELTEEELFNKLGEITLSLKDGHSSLIAYYENSEEQKIKYDASYDFISEYPAAFDIEILAKNYIGLDINPNTKKLLSEDGESIRAIYGSLPGNEEIAYIWIPSWDVTIEDTEIDSIFMNLKDHKALIFDIRQNTGGDPALATKFASYFLDERTYTGFERFKTGPESDDFVDSPNNLEPANSEYLWDKEFCVLTDRFVYSAALTFCYSVMPDKDVTFVGQRAGGGCGSVSDGYLMNGWYWSLSVSEYFDYQENHLDNGFEPDYQVELNLEDKDKDEILEKAIELLK
jgi:C-terminal processing protease CtpA/Prc